jgi:hypothetical protein
MNLDKYMKLFVKDENGRRRINVVSRNISVLDYIPDVQSGGASTPSIFKSECYYLEADEAADFRFNNSSRFMFIRPVYSDIVDSIMDMDAARQSMSPEEFYEYTTDSSQVSGCEGIGKSFWIYYFIYRILTQPQQDSVVVLNMFAQNNSTKADDSYSVAASYPLTASPWIIADSMHRSTVNKLVDSASLTFPHTRYVNVSSDPANGVPYDIRTCEQYMMHPGSLIECAAIALCPRHIRLPGALPGSVVLSQQLYVTPLSVAFLRFIVFFDISPTVSCASRRMTHTGRSLQVVVILLPVPVWFLSCIIPVTSPSLPLTTTAHSSSPHW